MVSQCRTQEISPHITQHATNSLSLTDNMFTSLVISGLLSTATAQYAGCPEPYGLQVYPHEQYCDKFYKCANGKWITLKTSLGFVTKPCVCPESNVMSHIHAEEVGLCKY